MLSLAESAVVSADGLSAVSYQVAMSLRWAFCTGTWNPTKEEWLQCGASIQPEEKKRISQFCYRKDAKAAMAGRLMLRKAISEVLEIDYSKLLLSRTREGKPYLANPGLAPDKEQAEGFSVNISHQGAFTVLAADLNRPVGVDVMDLTRPTCSSIPEFFHLMRRQFTEAEWEVILNPPTDSEKEREEKQLAQFFRFWCLKESYIKATGLGLKTNLQSLSFSPQPAVLPQDNRVYLDTRLFIDNKLSVGWTFEESFIDEKHVAAVCLGPGKGTASTMAACTPFTQLMLTELLGCAKPQTAVDEEFWLSFSSKEERPRTSKPS